MSRALVVVPHADELAFHVGGTIAKRVAEGHSIYQVVVTAGATASFTKEKGEMEQIIRGEARRSAELLGLEDIFLWDYHGPLREDQVMEIQERLVALVRRLDIDTIFGFDPWSPRDCHPSQLIVGKATYWTAYFSGFPLHYPHHRDLGLESCMIVEQNYFAYHPEGDHLEAVDISETIDKKVEAILAFESQMQWCADIAIAHRQRQGLPTDDIDRDNYGSIIAAQTRSEAVERGAAYGLDYAEVLRHLSAGEEVLT
ncbi:PIG-L deacetylase family protein [Candidatus Poribacteria bacterium]